MPKITTVHARQILDSRGNPTVEVDVTLDDGAFGRASVPSGASVGSHEAIELRDGDADDYHGQGVEKVIKKINTEIAGFLQDNDPFNQVEIDNEMVLRDATKNSSRLGANAILGVSLAMSRAAAASLDVPYYCYINQFYNKLDSANPPQPPQLPTPMFNVLNGGVHTHWQSTDVQEFMIVPLRKVAFDEQLRQCAEIYHCLGEILQEKNYSTLVGDEGGFAPPVKNDREALELLMSAIAKAGYKPGKEIGIAIDAAMSEQWSKTDYHLKIQDCHVSTDDVIAKWQDWVRKYPIISIEDGLAEEDWAGWTKLNKALGDQIRIVGDDLLATNVALINKAIQHNACNTLLMKVNQIGTLTESLQAIIVAKAAGWNVIVSHRSGETEDTSIADIVVGTHAGFIKSGAPARGERLAKYNQLLRIEEDLRAK